MTPTRDQLDAVLTRSSAGVSAMTGDLDDAEERARALDWLEKTIREAVEVRSAPRMARGGPVTASDSLWWAENGRAVLREGSNRPEATQSPFPPPAKGSHEEDMPGVRFGGYLRDEQGLWVDNEHGMPRGGIQESNRAAAWSRTPDDRSSNT